MIIVASTLISGFFFSISMAGEAYPILYGKELPRYPNGEVSGREMQALCNGAQSDELLGVRKLGISIASLARRFNISIVAVSKSVFRIAEIAQKKRYELSKLIS